MATEDMISYIVGLVQGALIITCMYLLCSSKVFNVHVYHHYVLEEEPEEEEDEEEEEQPETVTIPIN